MIACKKDGEQYASTGIPQETILELGALLQQLDTERFTPLWYAIAKSQIKKRLNNEILYTRTP